MKLATWLMTEGVAQYEAAESIGVSPSALNRMIKGNEVPTSDEIYDLYQYTDGHVTVDDWAEEYPEVSNWIKVVTECQRF